MSRHHDDFAAAGLPLLLEQHGEPIVYRGAGEDPRDVWAICSAEQVAELGFEDGLDETRTRQVTLLRDPATPTYGGIADPSDKAQICIAGVEYSVLRIPVQTATYATLEVVRRAVTERSRGQYRRRT